MSSESNPNKGGWRRPVGRRLQPVLIATFVLFGLVAVNGIYLLVISLLSRGGQSYETWFYLFMFLAHVAVGLLLTLISLTFIGAHIYNVQSRPNRRAVSLGYVLFAVVGVLLISGIALVRLEGVIEVKDPTIRRIAYWAHLIAPVAVIWLYILHRLSGRKLRWRLAIKWGGVVGLVSSLVFAMTLVGAVVVISTNRSRVKAEERARHLERQRALETEIETYQEFCRYRSAEENRRRKEGLDPVVGREDWLADKRAVLHLRMRQRRSRRAAGNGWGVRLF